MQWHRNLILKFDKILICFPIATISIRFLMLDGNKLNSSNTCCKSTTIQR